MTDRGIPRHPSRSVLLVYAEGLADGGSMVSARVAAHLAGCPACKAEADAIRVSLALGHKSPALEPSTEFTKQLLMAAQRERCLLRERRVKRPVVVPLLRGIGYAAGLALISVLCFGASVGGKDKYVDAQGTVVKHASEAAISPEALRKAVTEIQSLAAAVSFPSSKQPSLRELERRRTVHALSADIETARDALQRNPGCERASRMVDMSLQRQAQTLRALYAERSL